MQFAKPLVDVLEDRVLLAATFYWTGATSADWGTAKNWDVNNNPAATTPGAGDSVELNTDKPCTISGKAVTVADLTIDALFTGAFTLNASLVITETFKMSSGTVTGPSNLILGANNAIASGDCSAGTIATSGVGGMLLVYPGSTLTFSGGVALQRKLNNEGIVQLQDSVKLTVGPNGSIDNDSNGLNPLSNGPQQNPLTSNGLLINQGATVAWATKTNGNLVNEQGATMLIVGSAMPTVDNPSPIVTTIQTPFTNNGDVRFSNLVFFKGGGNSSGTYTMVANGGTLVFTSPTSTGTKYAYVWNAGTQFLYPTGANASTIPSIYVASATVTVNTPANQSISVPLLVLLNGSTITGAGNLALGSSLNSPATVPPTTTKQGGLDWMGGTMSGTGTTTVNKGASAVFGATMPGVAPGGQPALSTTTFFNLIPGGNGGIAGPITLDGRPFVNNGYLTYQGQRRL